MTLCQMGFNLCEPNKHINFTVINIKVSWDIFQILRKPLRNFVASCAAYRDLEDPSYTYLIRSAPAQHRSSGKWYAPTNCFASWPCSSQGLTLVTLLWETSTVLILHPVNIRMIYITILGSSLEIIDVKHSNRLFSLCNLNIQYAQYLILEQI